jgi:hypothetical protein
MSDVRDRWGGARILAALGMAAAMAGAMHAGFLADPPDKFFDRQPVYIAAAAAGFIAGWRHLGVRLGRSMMETLNWSVGAAFLAAIYYSLMLALKDTVDNYSFAHFTTAMALINYLIDHAVTRLIRVALLPVSFYILVGALAAGVASEAAHRVWR